MALILLFRPDTMFHPDGRWREFGMTTGKTTFPFWLFCIVWAMVSYLVALGILRASAAPIVAATALTTRARAALQEIPYEEEEETPEDMVLPLPTKPARAKNVAALGQGNMKPGYYMLNRNALRKTGIPKYIYLGPEPEEGDDGEESFVDVPTTTSA